MLVLMLMLMFMRMRMLTLTLMLMLTPMLMFMFIDMLMRMLMLVCTVVGRGQAGDLEGMRMYVEGGGSVKKRDFFNNTALHRSASMGFTVITGYLLESGAEVDAVANDGW